MFYIFEFVEPQTFCVVLPIFLWMIYRGKLFEQLAKWERISVLQLATVIMYNKCIYS